MTLFDRRKVPNQHPTLIGTPYKIAFVGEAPGRQEDETLQPFVGGAGDMLNSLCQDAGIQRAACYVGNICQERPPDNKLIGFDWLGAQIQDGISQLHHDIKRVDPNLVVLLGGIPLHVAKSPNPFPWRKTKKNKYDRYPISYWRGSLFTCDIPTSPFFNRKCMAAYHPAYLLRVYGDVLVSRFDFIRARQEGCLPNLILPQRNIVVDVTLDYLVRRFEEILERKPRIGIDIEGYPNNIKCMSIAVTPQDVFIVPFQNMDGSSYWSISDEATIWYYLIRILGSAEIIKVMQAGLYESFCYLYSHELLIRGYEEDTMFKHWETLCETDKGLEFQASIYTREPYYKDERGATDRKTFWTYCCKDSAVTLECSDAQDKSLAKNPLGASHYRFNLYLAKYPLLYMMHRGFRFDSGKRDRRVKELSEKADELQANVKTLSGHDVNVSSPKQMLDFLYVKLGLPIQYKKQPKYSEKEPSPTADFEALLNLAMTARSEDQKALLMNCIRLRETKKRASDLREMGVDLDGRVRFSLNPVGTVTGRIACYTSATGSGCNGQTIRKEDESKPGSGDRDLFLADEGYDMFEADLRGADGWTVAAHCARLGDSTMLEDLIAGVRIPSIIALIVKHGPVINSLDRAALKVKCKEVPKNTPLDFSCKQVQHGTNYGMKPATVVLRIFIESYGEIRLPEETASLYQKAYLGRYRGILLWHDWMREQVRKGKYLATATGHTRIIQGRRASEDTLKELLSDEPQQNTTFATNLAAVQLWRDPSNRRGRKLISEPIHQVHDALIGQWRREDRDYGREGLRRWFGNPLTIAGRQITIPFEGHIGPSWGEKEIEL